MYGEKLKDRLMIRVAAILGDGHGDDTLAKWSPVFKRRTVVGDVTFGEGERFRENDFNAPVVDMLERELNRRNIVVRQLAPEKADISLSERARRHAKVYAELKEMGYVPVTISVHANGLGYGDRWNNAQGIETYYKEGCEGSKELAELIQENVMKVRRNYLPYNTRTDRGVKTANFYVFRNYEGVVVLPESEFMTNKQTLNLLCSVDYRRETVMAYADAIETFQGYSFIGDLDPKTEKRV